MKQKIFGGVLLVAMLVGVLPDSAQAAYRTEVSGWVPYWTEEEGIESVIDKVDQLDILYLFVYEVNDLGKLVAKVDLEDGVWEDLIDEARDEDVEIIPTIAWFDGPAIHAMLSNKTLRKAHVREIEDMVDDMRFDGVNIDYESKLSITIDYFSDFLKELEDKLGRDELTCTIEARTPADSLWKPEDKPAVINYANDYQAFNKYCDWVEIMAYDQQRADLVLNKERQGLPYNPVADIDWVEKVVELALEDIDADKIMLGIPTYGRAWDVTVAPDWYRDYTRVASVDHSRNIELSEIYDVPIGRTAGGEAIITYFPETSVYKLFNQLPTPEGTPKGYEAAAKALQVANITGMEIPVRILTWGDAIAAKDKFDLIEKYDLKGAAFFKFDGEEDQDIWDLF